MRISQIRSFLMVLAVVALAPAAASAQVAAAPPATGRTAPSGPDTPTVTIPGSIRLAPSNIDAPLPTVDSSGANRSSRSTTGEVAPPIGAPRLPGEPLNPPTGPDD